MILNKRSSWSYFAPGVFQRKVRTPKQCDNLLDYCISNANGWIGPENAEDIHGCPRVLSGYPDYFSPEDVEWAIRNYKRFREFPTENMAPQLQLAMLRFAEELMPSVAAIHGIDLRRPLDPFVACYEAREGHNAFLSPHVDKQRAAVVVQLNSPRDYQGGGTRYTNLGVTAPEKVGMGVTHTGAKAYEADPEEAEELYPHLVHEALEVTEGARYTLCLFYL